MPVAGRAALIASVAAGEVPGSGMPVCCRCGSALMAAQPASRKIGCACGRVWAG